MIKRLLAAMLCLLLIVSLPVQVLAAGANADTPQTHPNTYTNTGNQRVDIIGVAKTQVGYLEGPGNNTKYGAALNINMLGWCGAFVSWCAIQAGVPDSVLYKTGVANPASYGLTAKYYPEYIPQSGDLFFTPSNSHVGLVYYLDGEYFYSIEGNTYSQGPEGVYIRRHKLSDMKYGSPNYQGSGNHKYTSDSDVEHPHKVYFRCTDCGDKYYSGATVTRADCLQCKQATCSHSYGKWSKSNDSQHAQTCTKCGKVNLQNHSWDSGTVTTQPNCSTTGTKTQNCTVCGATKTSDVSASLQNHKYASWTEQDSIYHYRACSLCASTEVKAHSWDKGTVTKAATCMETGITTFICKDCGAQKETVIPISRTHTYSEWKSIDNDRHTHSCLVCGVQETYYHKFSNKYQTNQTSHWYACSDCGLKKNEEKHEFGEVCDSPCKICKYKSDTGHHFVEEYSKDENSHWFACQSCDIQGSAGYHQFDNECDDLCDTCGFTRVIKHALTVEYQTDGSHHWYVCTICGIQDSYGTHEPGDPAYEGAATYCKVCNIVLTEEKNHEHIFAESFGDEINHWGTCVCGEILEAEAHVWSMKTGTCSACGISRPEIPEETHEEVLPWIFVGAGLSVLVTVLVILIIRISKKTKEREMELLLKNNR